MNLIFYFSNKKTTHIVTDMSTLMVNHCSTGHGTLMHRAAIYTVDIKVPFPQQGNTSPPHVTTGSVGLGPVGL